jgi:chemotaxis protein MotB
MARRRPEEPPISHERWLVSYADFITLLFAFFVVMYSISQVNEGKYRILSDTLVSAFNNSIPTNISPIQVGDPSLSVDPSAIDLQSIETLKVGEGDFDGDGSFDKTADLPQLSDLFEKEFSALIAEQKIQLHSNELWLEVELSSSILFESADAEASLQAENIFADIAGILKPFNNPIQVEGFTDDIPINNAKFPSNWELSAARAASVVRLLMAGDIEAKRLSAVGYGEFQPVADNNTVEGRSKNRRVVLMIAREKQNRPNVKTFEDVEQAVNPPLIDVSEPYVQPGLGDDITEMGSLPVESAISPLLEATEGLDVGNTLDDIDKNTTEVEDRLAPIGDIKPVETNQGGLLFTSDPNLPRN